MYAVLYNFADLTTHWQISVPKRWTSHSCAADLSAHTILYPTCDCATEADTYPACLSGIAQAAVVAQSYVIHDCIYLAVQPYIRFDPAICEENKMTWNIINQLYRMWNVTVKIPAVTWDLFILAISCSVAFFCSLLGGCWSCLCAPEASQWLWRCQPAQEEARWRFTYSIYAWVDVVMSAGGQV